MQNALELSSDERARESGEHVRAVQALNQRLSIQDEATGKSFLCSPFVSLMFTRILEQFGFLRCPSGKVVAHRQEAFAQLRPFRVESINVRIAPTHLSQALETISGANDQIQGPLRVVYNRGREEGYQTNCPALMLAAFAFV